MKVRKILFVSLSLLFFSLATYSQDKRTTETKVADLLARLPANDLQFTDKLMGDMLSLGETGIKQICDQIVPAGTGNDTRPRFAVESLTRFLSQKGKETEKATWEKTCISYATEQKDNGVKDFFMKQLQLIGGNQSAEAMKIYLGNKDICGPALAVITAVGGKTAETILAESLKKSDLPCAAAVMNALASIKSQAAVNEYITWVAGNDINIKASAYNALAQSGSPLAYPVLSKAAKEVSYRWEHTGATASLLNYAKVIGQNRDIKTMDKICKLIISKCDDNLTIQNKTVALDTYVGFHGIDAMAYLIKAAAHPNDKYRNAAMRMSLAIPGTEVVKKWIDYFPKAISAAKPEIITMLGERGDEMALPLITASLSDQDLNVRKEAAVAIVKISGNKSVPALIDYMMKFNSDSDQEAAKSALMTVADSDKMPLLIPVLKEGTPAARKSAIELLAWNKDNKYFSEVLPFASSTDEQIKSAAIKALASLAGSADQEKLIALLAVTDNQGYIADIQTSLAVAAGKISDPEKRSSAILKAMEGKIQKEKLIPVLAKTGGQKALAIVLKEFENGNSAMRDICFKALTSWRDYSASSALYEICASGNKTFEGPAFEGYIRQIKSADLPDEQKLLLYRKIMPFALSSERKNEVLTEIGKLKTYQALYFVANYLDDPATSAAAAKAAMLIALPSVSSKAGMYGNLVKEILVKATGKIKGQESEYDKEMINKYLAGMPADEEFRDISEKEYNLTPEEKTEGFVALFNGRNLDNWVGNKESYIAEDAMIVVKPSDGSGGNLYTEKEYADFIFRFEFLLTPAANNGLGIRAPLTGDAAYVGMELQILDDTAPVYANLQPYQYHGSVYGVIPAKRGFLKPVGEWNYEEVKVQGTQITITLNGTVIVDGDIAGPRDNGTLDKNDHPGLKNKTGHIGFLGHGSELKFRNIRIKY